MVNKKNSPFTVKTDAETPGIVSNLLSWAGNTLNVWHDEQENVVSQMEMRSRGDLFEKPPLKAPLFAQEKIMIVEGKRPLNIAWSEGRGPYSVRLIEQNTGEALFEVSEVEGERLKTGELSLVSDRDYRLEISDVGETLSFQLVAQKPEALPKAVKEITESKLHPSAMQLLYATWLAGIHEEWSFEAYQIVSGIEAEYTPGQVLRVALEQGQKPE